MTADAETIEGLAALLVDETATMEVKADVSTRLRSLSVQEARAIGTITSLLPGTRLVTTPVPASAPVIVEEDSDKCPF
jgi:hypothetical protein